ncbi:MAG TPA: hypothetical protein VNS32_10120 [Flavisolibacter sp.]|nr:hypothetical protein [Flavisolibacter sp.]
MKAFTLLILLALSGCATKQSLQVAIEGVYVRDFQNEFYITSDTLVISGFNKEAGSYVIEERTGSQPIRDGKIRPKQFHQTKEISHYDYKSAQLMGQRTGKIYSFPSSGTGLLRGTSPYRKIK